MLYVVEIRRERAALSKVMSEIREWLDAQRFEPDAFRCATADDSIICRLEFSIESEAADCDAAFNGRIARIGDDPSPRDRGVSSSPP